jgi:hypothetical protein
MMRPWTQILPFFIVRYIALKSSERFVMDKKVWVQVYADTFIRVKDKP